MGAFVSAAKNNKNKSRRYAFRNEAAVSALAIALGLGAVWQSYAQDNKPAAVTPAATVPEIVVTAPKQKPKVTRTQRAAGIWSCWRRKQRPRSR